jgi:hypothetical protein
MKMKMKTLQTRRRSRSGRRHSRRTNRRRQYNSSKSIHLRQHSCLLHGGDGSNYTSNKMTIEEVLNDPAKLERVGVRNSNSSTSTSTSNINQPVQPIEEQPRPSQINSMNDINNTDIPMMHSPELDTSVTNLGSMDVYQQPLQIQQEQPSQLQNAEDTIKTTISNVGDLAKNTTSMITDKLKGLFGGKQRRNKNKHKKRQHHITRRHMKQRRSSSRKRKH